MSKHIVAVYGTLRDGFGNHVLVMNSKFLGPETINVPYTMHSLTGFPALVPSKEHNHIVFEMYEVDDATLKNLDSLEGYNPNEPEWSFYDRVTLETRFGEALVYIMHECDGPIVESGDWYLEKKGVTANYEEETV